MIVPHPTMTTHSGMQKGPGLQPRPSVLPIKRLSLRVGPYLAVDLLEEGLAVLVILLELTHLPQLLGGKAVDPLGDLLHGQPFVVGGLKRSQHSGPQLRLAGNFLRLTKNLIRLLGGLLGYPQSLPR